MTFTRPGHHCRIRPRAGRRCWGACVADAASLGLHGLYSPERIALIERTGDILFRQPDRCHYDGQPGYFAHEGRRAGMPSQYGEHLALVAALLRRDGGQSPAAHQRDFLARFGPGGSWVGYADRPTRALVARLLSEAGEVPAVTGIDDDQMPVLSVVAPLHDAGASRGQVSDSVRVLSTNAEAKAGALALFDLLAAFERSGIDLLDASSRRACLGAIAESAGSGLDDLLLQRVNLPPLSPAELAERFGAACHIRQGLPIAFHLAAHMDDFGKVLRDNVRIGGDSCGRAMAIGALAGIVFGVPEKFGARLTAG